MPTYETLPFSSGVSKAASLTIDSSQQYKTSSGSEQLLYQDTLDFDVLDVGVTSLRASLSALTRQGSGAGTYLVRIGGTVDVANGTIVATIVTTHNAGYTLPVDGVVGPAFARPSGRQLVKITGASSGVGVLAFIKGFAVTFA